MGSSQDWKPLVNDHFSDYCNILVDIPGQGESNLNNNNEFRELLNDLLDQLKSAGFDQFIPIGYSMGGRIAFHIQNRYPKHIPAMVGLSAAPGLLTESERATRRTSDLALMDELEQVGFDTFLRKWYSLSLFQSIGKNSHLIEALIRSRSQNDSVQLSKTLLVFGNGAMKPLWDDLPSMNIPVLLLSGALDKKYCGINSEMLSHLPMGEHHTIENADHAFHLEKQLDTANLIRHFLRQVIKGA